MTTDPIKRDIAAGWDEMSVSYQSDSEISLEDVHYGPFTFGERELSLLGLVEGKVILELACGGAQNSIALSKWGAKCIGLDISPQQLRMANAFKTQESVDIALVRGDMECPTMFVPETFDIILSSFGWEFIPDLSTCFASCHRLLKPGGTLLVCTAHPLNAFDWDDQEGGVLVTDYFNPPVEIWEDHVPDGHLPASTFFHTFSELFGLLTNANFCVENVLEPYPHYLEKSSHDSSVTPYGGSYWESNQRRLSKVPFSIVFLARKNLAHPA